jgi:hypothetical protein
MGLLTRILRLSGPTHSRPLCSSLLSPTNLVPNHISSPRVLGKRALVLKIQTLLFPTKLPSALILSEITYECCTAPIEQRTALVESI